MVNESKHQQLVGFIWSVADLLRGDYKQSEYGRVILPLTVLWRLDCVLEPTKPAVLAAKAANEGEFANLEPVLRRAAASCVRRCGVPRSSDRRVAVM